MKTPCYKCTPTEFVTSGLTEEWMNGRRQEREALLHVLSTRDKFVSLSTEVNLCISRWTHLVSLFLFNPLYFRLFKKSCDDCRVLSKLPSSDLIKRFLRACSTGVNRVSYILSLLTIYILGNEIRLFKSYQRSIGVGYLQIHGVISCSQIGW